MKTVVPNWQGGILYKPFGLTRRAKRTWLRQFLSSGPLKHIWSSQCPLNHSLELNWGKEVQLGSTLGNWIQFFSFSFEASPSLAWQSLFYSWIGFIASSILFDIYSVNFTLGYMRHVATRIPKWLYCKSEALAFKDYCLSSKFQNLILEPKAEKNFGTFFDALRWTNDLEPMKFFDSLWRRKKL